MQVKNEQKIQKKKEHILASLRRLLSREVYSRITLQDIAREAGFSKGGLLHYYSSREQIFIELTDHFFGNWRNGTILSWRVTLEAVR